MRRILIGVLLCGLAGCACPGNPSPPSDSDAGPPDAGTTVDAGSADGGQPVGFIAVGDTGKANAAQKKVASAMANWCRSHRCDFVVLLGDNFYPSGVASTTDNLWKTAFEDVYAQLDVPFYAVLGNHDYGANGLGTDLPKAQNEIDYTQVSTKWKMPANHYRFTFGNIEIFVADTNLSMLGLDQTVRSDFQRWTSTSTAKWKFAAGHHPYLSNGPHGNAGTYDNTPNLGSTVKSFIENDVCGKVDFYLSGHDHSRQWLSTSCSGTELIVSGGGADATAVTARNAAHFSQGNSGFLYFTVDEKTATGTFVDADGNENFSRTLSK